MSDRISPTAIALQLGLALFIAMVARVRWPSEYSDTRTMALLCAGGGPLMTLMTFDGVPWRSWYERAVAYAGVACVWALVATALIAPHLFSGAV